MNSFRKWSCLAVALLAAAFSSIAWSQSNDNKHFSFQAQAGAPSNTQIGSDVRVTITNTNPSGSSAQLGSFFITVSGNGSPVNLLITNATKVSGPRGGTISVSPDGTSVTVTGINPLKANQSYVLDITLNGCGDAYPWTAQAWSGPTLNGTQYLDDASGGVTALVDVSVPCGLLTDCSGGTNSLLSGSTVGAFINDTITDNKGKPLSRRGVNQDGSGCPAINYFITDVTGANALHVRWDNGTAASFFYVLSAAHGPVPPPAFSWKNDTNGNPVFVTAQTCDQGKKAAFPSPYGTLTSNVNAGDPTIAVTLNKNTNTPPTPFRIAVGLKISNALEFMTVTNISQGTWTVARDPTNPTAHSAGDVVMSTPASVLPTPPVCVDSGLNPMPSCPANTYVGGGPALVCYVPTTDTNNAFVFDVGDSWTLGR
jgi:hypothetical protein